MADEERTEIVSVKADMSCSMNHQLDLSQWNKTDGNTTLQKWTSSYA